MAEIFTNDNRVVITPTTGLLQFKPEIEPWYEPNDNTIRYYKLDDLDDSSGYGGTLTNVNTVVFSSGYAEFNGVDNYLKDETFNFVVSANTTFFSWFSIDTTSLFNNVTSVGFDETTYDGAINCFILDQTTVQTRGFNQWSSPGYTSFLGDTWNGSTGTDWWFICYTQQKVGSTVTGYLYSGTTSETYLCSSEVTGQQTIAMDEIVLGGNAIVHDRLLDGRISGTIVEEAYWTSSDISDQAAKGPYYDY